MGRDLRVAALPLLCCLAATSLSPGLASQTMSAVMFANDTIYARRVDPAGAVLLEDTHPPGLLTNASVSIGGTARLACSLTAAGDEHTLAVSMTTAPPSWPNPHQTHADLTLWLLGPANRTIGIDLELRQGGDINADGLRVDIGDDGSFEHDTSCPFACHDPVKHRAMHWSFSNGPLPIRIRADDSPMYAYRGFSMTMRIRPWIEQATPEAADCGGIVWYGPNYFPTSSSAFLFAEASTQPSEFGVLRAMGFGNFGAFLVSTAPATTPLTLPPPFSATCDVLAFSFADAPGGVSESILLGSQPPMPREWTLPIPALPPGLTFYVQHASAEPTALVPFYNQPWFGTSNVIRIDT